MTLQLIHDVQILDPSAVAVEAAHIGILPALLANLALEQAVVHCVLHLSTVQASEAA
jgi:hypothetical protein